MHRARRERPGARGGVGPRRGGGPLPRHSRSRRAQGEGPGPDHLRPGGDARPHQRARARGGARPRREPGGRGDGDRRRGGDGGHRRRGPGVHHGRLPHHREPAHGERGGAQRALRAEGEHRQPPREDHERRHLRPPRRGLRGAGHRHRRHRRDQPRRAPRDAPQHRRAHPLRRERPPRRLAPLRDQQRRDRPAPPPRRRRRLRADLAGRRGDPQRAGAGAAALRGTARRWRCSASPAARAARRSPPAP